MAAKCLLLLASLAGLSAWRTASAADGTIKPGTRAPQKTLKEGWEKRVPIPHPTLGEGDQYVVWVRDGWLQAKREKATGETDWQVVLARASDPTPPVVEAPPGSVRFEVSYRGGRYFVREDAFVLRFLRERKPQQATQWPGIRLGQMDATNLRASAGSVDRPPAIGEFRSGDWIVVASGPAPDRADCILRLCPIDADVEKNGGWGAAAMAHPSSFRDIFYKDSRVLDDGELLVANRLLNCKPGPVLGEQAPPLAAKTLDGKPLKLADFKGKYVLLDFWATWCGPCVAELPHIRELHETYGGDKRFVIIGLSVDDAVEAPARFVAKKKLPWLQGFLGNAEESQAAKDYGINAIPATFLIGPDGKIIAKGLRDKELSATIANALQSGKDKVAEPH